MPESDSIIVIWFKLLCLAGKQNNSGVFQMSNGFPYTDKMLSTIFRRKESTVQLALKTFENFGMIEMLDNTITIPNWGKHQNLDKIEQKNAYMKAYMQNYRQKQLCKANSKDNSKSNVSEADKNRIDKNKNREEIDCFPPASGMEQKKGSKHCYGEYNHVKLTDNEYEKLKERFGDLTDSKIKYMDEQIEMKGYKYKSHYMAILKWSEQEKKNGGFSKYDD